MTSPDNKLVNDIGAHIAQMAPHQKARRGGQLLIAADSELRRIGLLLATLCDMVLGEDAEDHSDEALMRGVRGLLPANGRANFIDQCGRCNVDVLLPDEQASSSPPPPPRC